MSLEGTSGESSLSGFGTSITSFSMAPSLAILEAGLDAEGPELRASDGDTGGEGEGLLAFLSTAGLPSLRGILSSHDSVAGAEG